MVLGTRSPGATMKRFAKVLMLSLACSISLMTATPSLAGSGEQARPDPKSPAPPQADSAIISTVAGPLQGFETKGITEFLGIPYAEAPMGSLRWRPPVRRASWTKVRHATSFGSNCPQVELNPFAGPTSRNEDCLFLNVFTPAAHNPSAKLPVIVWIHGGGNHGGEGTDYDGSKLAAKGPTVVVTTNYRLGLLGFMAHPAIDAEGHLFANYGLLDQQLALKWVQGNIAKFGGDPRNVTLAGESAGSVDTEAHVISPLAKGLFHRAIFQSAVLEASPLANAEDKGKAFAIAAGCGTAATTEVATCLRDLSVDQILALPNPFSYAVQPLGIIADGTILPTTMFTALIAAGRFNHMPIMSGSTADEVQNFILAIQQYSKSPRVPFSAADYMAFVSSLTGPAAGSLAQTLETYPPGTPAAVMAHYPLSAYATPQLAMDAIGTDPLVCEQRHHNRLFASQVSVYAYEFNDRTAPSYFPEMPGFLFLASHTLDIQYLFPLFHGGPLGTPHPLNAEQELLSDKMVAAWTNFARTGNPNGVGNVPWPIYRPFEANATILSQGLSTPQPQAISGITLPPPGPRPRGFASYSDADFNEIHQCDFWASILSY